MTITNIAPNLQVIEMTPKWFLAAVIDNSGKLITLETFDTFDAAESALRMIYHISSGAPALGVTVEEYLAECFRAALSMMDLTINDIAPIKKNLAQIFTNAE